MSVYHNCLSFLLISAPPLSRLVHITHHKTTPYYFYFYSHITHHKTTPHDCYFYSHITRHHLIIISIHTLHHIFTGEIKSFFTHIRENPPRHLDRIVFQSGMGRNVQKGQYLAQNDQKCIFWTNFGRFWAKNPNF